MGYGMVAARSFLRCWKSNRALRSRADEFGWKIRNAGKALRTLTVRRVLTAATAWLVCLSHAGRAGVRYVR